MEESIVQKKILLVEDSPAHKELMARELTDAGFEIDQVESFNQCKNWIIDYGLPALIVADYLLPDGNALDILALVSQECPVVIMTSHGSEQSAVEAVKAGAQDYVVKSQEVFRGMGHIVRRALRDWQHIEEVREAEKELIKKDSILNGLAEILSILLGSPDPSSVMHEVLAILGKSSECDRVSVFQNSYNENNVRCMTLTHEWVRHHSFAQLTNAEMRDLPYASLSVENERDLESGKTIQSIFHQMSLAERELFGAAGIKSILSVPVITETGFWGFVGFDSFTNYNQWSSSVIALLQMAARAIASAINRMLAEKRQLEIECQMQQSQKLESLGVLAGGIAHDFNNILMAIMGHSDLALQDLSPLSPVRENLVEIERASKRAADLCKQMLAYSGRGRFVLEKINLNELIREMIYLLRSSISKKAVLNMNLDEKIVLVEGDATQIRQIVMNLIINASDALNDAMGVITITTSEEEYSSDQLSQMDHGVDLRVGRYAKIEVIDTGTGMQSEVIAKIFDPFFTTKFTGRGLGLAAVLGIVRSHQGALSVTSEPGMGTNFTILFPACEKNNDRNSEQTGEGRAITHQNYKTVLLVDDEESVRNLGRLMLERCGYRVLTAANGLEAIEKYVHNADKISCTMLDLTMPVMDGEEAFNKIKAIYPDACIIITSGYDKEEIEQRFMGSDLAGVIEKPYRLEKLASALKEILETREK